MNTRLRALGTATFVTSLALGLSGLGAGCSGSGAANADAGPDTGGVTPSPVVISAGTRTPVTATRSINYWQWAPSYGDDIAGTDSLLAPLGFSLVRVGGYNNDANLPDAFDEAQLDKAVAYITAIGAEPLIQVPLLAGPDHGPSSPDTAAAMVRYANVTQNYGIKYFSVGNEPDLYALQGGLSNPTAPAVPGYGPADYCAAATDYVAAMKAVDPTIRIVGPDLGFQYSPGMDFLTPILTECGELFDVIAVHRYAGSSAQATLPRISTDADNFRDVVRSVRQIMASTGQGDKPLGITEMNIDYDALPTSNVPAAACGTVPSALWAVDVLAASSELDLWTTALWNIADDPSWRLGMIDVPPTHTPRPQYYAYLLTAQHSGPTRLDVRSSPAGVHVYASRNATDDTSFALVVNWNTHAVPLEFRVEDLSPAPEPAIFTLPALSLAAIDIPDHAPATALVYGAAQHDRLAGPETLSPGIGPLDDDAGSDAGTDAGPDAPTACAQAVLGSPAVTTNGTSTGVGLFFGSGADRWGSYAYAGPGQSPPVASVTSDGNGFELDASFVPPLLPSNDYMGFGFYYSSSSCVDARPYTGLEFDLSGDLGDCTLSFAVTFSDDVAIVNDAVRGRCTSSGVGCLPPQIPLVVASGTTHIPFASLSGGAPIDALDAGSLIGMQWQLSGPLGSGDAGGGCSAAVTIENVSFY